jgi:uncharacterized membrane protein YdbT with pleckstrin-like domain
VAFSEKQLNVGEKAVLDLRPHWWFFAPQAAALAGAVVLGVLALAFFADVPLVSILTAGLIIMVLVWFVARYLVWQTTNFVITSDRLVTRSGVFSRQGIEIPLERVNTVFFRQSLFERLIGSGELVVESAGELGQQKFSDIKQPLKVQNEIYRQMEGNENRKFDRVGRSQPATLSIPEQIEKLDELRQKGIVTDAEFNRKKAELLDRL